MSSTFASQGLIHLPRLSGAEAASLIGEMLTVAQSQPSLPGPIERSRVRLTTAHAALENALRKATAQPAGSGAAEGAQVSPAIRRKADKAIDTAWEALFDWLSGWCKLADEANPYRSAARSLFELIFADALAFGNLPYKIEWLESKMRLATIEREGHEATFKALGGIAFLAHLRHMHDALDRLAINQDEKGVDVREQLAAAASALRQYVVRVTSHADAEVAGSEALSDALLDPLARWLVENPARPPHLDFGPIEETVY